MKKVNKDDDNNQDFKIIYNNIESVIKTDDKNK